MQYNVRFVIMMDRNVVESDSQKCGGCEFTMG